MVTVAVVSWNTRELLARCLLSLEPEVRAARAEVWVVDNGSTDGSRRVVGEVAPWAHLLAPEENLGFGRAVNLVAARSESPWLLAANADVALEPGALPALVDSAREPAVGCAAPRLILPSGETQHSAFAFPSLSFSVAMNLGLTRLSGRLAERYCLAGAWNPERHRAVPWALGACLLIRRSAFRAVGGFDERQWMYAEDLDLGWRLHRNGWSTVYVPEARVLHESGASAQSAFGAERTATFMTATYVMLCRRRGKLRAGGTIGANVLGALARMTWMIPLGFFSARWRARVRENRHWLRAHLSAARAARRRL